VINEFPVDERESALKLRHYFSGASKLAATDAICVLVLD
jgi:hypothetical protein